MKVVIKTDKAPKAIGPYSQAIMHNNMLFISGQIPIDPKTGLLAERDIKKQTLQSLTNIKNILEEANLALENVIKTTVYMKNLNDFSAMNDTYNTFFKDPFPARATIEVSKLPKDSLVEIEVIAIK